MEIEFNEIGEHKIIAVSGEVDLYNVSELKKALFSITDEKCKLYGFIRNRCIGSWSEEDERT
jgi:hypothetical protein